MRALLSIALVVLFSFCGNHWSLVVSATDITWTSATNDEKDTAATAPKSQKYWDENNIERPDYAKTDAEIAAEKGGTSSSSWLGLILLVVLVGGGIFAAMKEGWIDVGGRRLGGMSAILFPRHKQEDARQARLARFEETSKKRE